MRKDKVTEWTMIAYMAFACVHVIAQQDEPPILKPKAKPVAAATLLVTCDLACNWKLDGEAKGRIAAGGSAKARVQLGQHLVVAVTEDDLDQAQEIIKVQEKGQLVVPMEFKSVREVRLRAEQERQDKAVREQQEKEREAQEQAAREQQEKDRQARERAAQEELDRLVWVDPATGLMWTKHDNGFQLTKWEDADRYCSALRLAGFADWRMPTIDELASINDPWGSRIGNGTLKGGIQISGVLVIGNKLGKVRKDGVQEVQDWTFEFWNGERNRGVLSANQNRVLCVRRAGI